MSLPPTSPRLEQLRQLAAALPADPLTQYGLALEYVSLERWDEAIAAFDETLRIDARYAAAYFQKARALLRRGRRGEAAATLEVGIAAAEANGDAHAAAEMRKMREAIA
ncbi:MAG: tetratricopeptide repeat protein [Planctomycetota bacterium]